MTKQQEQQKTGEKIMRNECVQMSLEDIYNDISKSMEDQKPALIELLETHIDFETMIPTSFYNAFYQRYRIGWRLGKLWLIRQELTARDFGSAELT